MVWTIFENLVQKNLNIEKIIFKVVQMKAVISSTAIFVAITNNTLYGSQL